MYEKDASKDVGYVTNTTSEDAFGAPPFRRFRLAYFIVLVILSTSASLYLLYVLTVKKFFRIHFYIFVGHLAVIYVVFGTFIIPLYIVMFETDGVWPLGQMTCVAWQVISNLCTYEMENMVVVIALDRMWAIYWPHNYRVHRNRRNLIGSLIVSWIYSGCTVLPTLIHDRLTVSYNVTVCDVSIKENYYYWRSTISMGFLAPAVGTLSVYFLIACKTLANFVKKRQRVGYVSAAVTDSGLRGREHDMIPGSHARRSGGAVVLSTGPSGTSQREGKRQEKVKMARERRVLIVVVIVLCNYIICLLPYALYCGLWFYNLVTPNTMAFTVCHMLMYSHPVLDSLAFILTNAEFRPAFLTGRKFAEREFRAIRPAPLIT